MSEQTSLQGRERLVEDLAIMTRERDRLQDELTMARNAVRSLLVDLEIARRNPPSPPLERE